MIDFIYTINRDLDRSCGIYKISNNRNNRIYIGSTNFLRKRFRDHWWDLKGNRHRNIRLQNFYNKYKSEEYNLRFELLELCESKNLFKREDYYLNILKPYYNICPTATGNMLGIVMSEKTKKKISETKKRLYREGLLVAKRLPLTETECPLCGKIFKAKKRKTKKLQKYCSMECKHKGQVIVISRPIIQLDLSNNFIREWPSAKEAGVMLGLNEHNIGDCCRGKHQTAHKYKWVFTDEYNEEKWIKCESIPFLPAICN